MLGRRPFLAGLAGLVCTPRAWACGWDRDTLSDEIQRAPSRFDLVSGQLPTHSNAWYERTIRESDARLALRRDDAGAVDDKGMALVHLRRLDEAAEVLEAAFARDPERYETLSNLGVLRKKQGRFAEASDLLKRALSKRPEGHLGIGDWYVRNVNWRARTKPVRSFVQVPYAGVLRAGKPTEYDVLSRDSHLVLGAVKRAGETWNDQSAVLRISLSMDADKRKALVARDTDRLERLARYDRTFTDGLFVLGDLQDDLHFSVIAFHRALDLGHPRPDILKKSLERVFAHWDAMPNRPFPSGFEASQAFARRADTNAKAWVRAFQQKEAELLKGADKRPTFAETERALEASGVRRSRSVRI